AQGSLADRPRSRSWADWTRAGPLSFEGQASASLLAPFLRVPGPKAGTPSGKATRLLDSARVARRWFQRPTVLLAQAPSVPPCWPWVWRLSSPFSFFPPFSFSWRISLLPPFCYPLFLTLSSSFVMLSFFFFFFFLFSFFSLSFFFLFFY